MIDLEVLIEQEKNRRFELGKSLDDTVELAVANLDLYCERNYQQGVGADFRAPIFNIEDKNTFLEYYWSPQYFIREVLSRFLDSGLKLYNILVVPKFNSYSRVVRQLIKDHHIIVVEIGFQVKNAEDKKRAQQILIRKLKSVLLLTVTDRESDECEVYSSIDSLPILHNSFFNSFYSSYSSLYLDLYDTLPS